MRDLTSPGPGTYAWAVPGSKPADGSLLGVEDLDREAVTALLDRAEALAAGSPPHGACRGAPVGLLFHEPSTRTRLSFARAARWLGAEPQALGEAGSSAVKGESLLDTARTLEALGHRALVLRHARSGAPHRLAPKLSVPLVNAGDGMHEHPTQALLDALAVRRRLGRLDALTVVFVGDVLHSRVARSTARLFALFGASVRLCAPATLLPLTGAGFGGASLHTDLTEALEGADVVVALRVQRERLVGGPLPSLADYARGWRIEADALDRLAPRSVFLHPGPMNRGVEVSDEVADGPRSLVADQVASGVPVRAAVLERALVASA